MTSRGQRLTRRFDVSARLSCFCVKLSDKTREIYRRKKEWEEARLTRVLPPMHRVCCLQSINSQKAASESNSFGQDIKSGSQCNEVERRIGKYRARTWSEFRDENFSLILSQWPVRTVDQQKCGLSLLEEESIMKWLIMKTDWWLGQVEMYLTCFRLKTQQLLVDPW